MGWLCLLGVPVLLVLAHAPGGPAPLRLIGAIAFLWLVPGHALARLSRRGAREFAPTLAFAYGGSAAWLALASAVCLALRLAPPALADLTAAFLALAGLWLSRPASPEVRAAEEMRPPSAPFASALQLLGLALLSALLLRAGATQAQGADTWDHLAYLKSILREGSVLPLREYYRETTAAALDLRKGFLHAPLAVTARLSGLPAPILWRLWPAFVGPCLVACFYVLARAMSGGVRGAAAIATLLFVAFYGGPGHAALRMSGYPNKTAEGLLWLAWAGSIGALWPGRRPAASPHVPFPVPWLLAASAMIHVFVPVLWFATWGVMSAAAWLLPALRASAARAGRLWLVSALACAPIFAWRLLTSYSTLNPIHRQLENIMLLPHGYVLDLGAWLSTLGAATWLSLLVSPFFLWSLPGPRRLFLCLSLWASLALLFNPLAMPLVAPRLGYLAARLYPAALALCLLGTWIAERLGRLGSGRAPGRAAAAAALVAAGLVLNADLHTAAWGYGPAARAAEREHSPETWKSSLEFLEARYPAARIVASDAVTDYSVAGLTRHDVLATLNQHASPSDTEAVARMRAALDILSPGAGPARTAEALRRYGVELVVVNHTFEQPLLDYLAFLDPRDYPGIERKFASHPEVFREVFQDGRQWIYEVRPEALARYASLPDEPWPCRPDGGAPAEGAARRGTAGDLSAYGAEDSLGYGLRMGAVRLGPRLVQAGATFDLSAALLRTGPLPAASLSLAQVRLDYADPAPGPRWLPSRLRRALAQHREGQFRRMTFEQELWNPRGGPEQWPQDCWMDATLRLRVHRAARAGAYLVSVRIAPQQIHPPVRAESYWSDALGPAYHLVPETLQVLAAPGPPMVVRATALPPSSASHGAEPGLRSPGRGR